MAANTITIECVALLGATFCHGRVRHLNPLTGQAGFATSCMGTEPGDRDTAGR